MPDPVTIDPRRALIQHVAQRAAEALGVMPDRVLAGGRCGSELALARHVARYVLIERFGLSTSLVARVGGAERSSAYNSRQVVELALRRGDARITALVEYVAEPPAPATASVADDVHYLRSVDRLAADVAQMATGAAEAMRLLARLAADVRRVAHTTEETVLLRAQLTRAEIAEAYPDLLGRAIEEAAG